MLHAETGRFVVEDFEDFGSWRTWAENTDQPAGQRQYGENLWLCGIFDESRAKFGQGVGEVRYWFKDNGKENVLWAKRFVVTQHMFEAMEAIEFWANPQGYEANIHFELMDAKKTKVQTPSVAISGNTWKKYRIPLSENPKLAQFTAPLHIEHFFMKSQTGGKGDVLLDDITVLGSLRPGQAVQILRNYEGMAYDPDQPLTAKYLVRNSLQREVKIPLQATLVPSYDAQLLTIESNPLSRFSKEIVLPPEGTIEVAVDFGKVPVGHYLARIVAGTE